MRRVEVDASCAQLIGDERGRRPGSGALAPLESGCSQLPQVGPSTHAKGGCGAVARKCPCRALGANECAAEEPVGRLGSVPGGGGPAAAGQVSLAARVRARFSPRTLTPVPISQWACEPWVRGCRGSDHRPGSAHAARGRQQAARRSPPGRERGPRSAACHASGHYPPRQQRRSAPKPAPTAKFATAARPPA